MLLHAFVPAELSAGIGGNTKKRNAPRRQNISWYNDSSIWVALPRRIRYKPLLNL